MTIPQPASHLKLTVYHVGLLLAIADYFYQYYIRDIAALDCLSLALLNSLVYTGILWITTRLDLIRTTICYLALPYLFFIPGWLNTPTLLFLSVIFIYALWRTLRNTHSVKTEYITLHDLGAFVVILFWINLSGTGGYGYQSQDWLMHNARLHDLTALAWPIRYGENQNLVYYIAYFLPSAIIGKLTSLDVGIRSLFPWTVLGVTLAIRWLGVLGQWRFSCWLVALFALFGPLDLPALLIFSKLSPAAFPDTNAIVDNPDYLVFASNVAANFFFGNYLSNTFQLYWSPHQIIAGWLCIASMSYLFLKQKLESVLFIYALLCLWSPLIMLALAPFALLTAGYIFFKEKTIIFRFQNIIGATSLVILFVIFYLSGAANTIPLTTLYTITHHNNGWLILIVFYLASFGIYTLVASPFVIQQPRHEKAWFGCLLITLLFLPVYILGEYSDLLCRGSAPLMFLLFVLLLKAITFYHQKKLFSRVVLLICLFIAGSGSSLLQGYTALKYYGETKATLSIPGYAHAYENFGPDNSLFERWFRKPLAPDVNPTP